LPRLAVRGHGGETPALVLTTIAGETPALSIDDQCRVLAAHIVRSRASRSVHLSETPEHPTDSQPQGPTDPRPAATAGRFPEMLLEVKSSADELDFTVAPEAWWISSCLREQLSRRNTASATCAASSETTV